MIWSVNTSNSIHKEKIEHEYDQLPFKLIKFV